MSRRSLAKFGCVALLDVRRIFTAWSYHVFEKKQRRWDDSDTDDDEPLVVALPFVDKNIEMASGQCFGSDAGASGGA